MPTVVQFRRGTTSQNNAFTGAVGELSVDTDLSTLRVHDGATAGGVEIVNVSSVQTMQNKVWASDLLPAADSAYDLGDSDFKWKDLHLSGNLTGNVTGNLTGAVTGNASTATALATGRTISLTGDATGTSGSFDGTGNASIAVSLAANTVTSSELSGATSLIIYNSAGTALKTLYGAGS